jgi:hypothetical protein
MTGLGVIIEPCGNGIDPNAPVMPGSNITHADYYHFVNHLHDPFNFLGFAWNFGVGWLIGLGAEKLGLGAVADFYGNITGVGGSLGFPDPLDRFNPFGGNPGVLPTPGEGGSGEGGNPWGEGPGGPASPVPSPSIPNLPPISGNGGGGGNNGNNAGDVHLTTFDGLHYDFQAAGEFILAQSTVPDDSFQVQVRMQPWYSGASVSVTTMAAIEVGSDRVTIGLGRANPAPPSRFRSTGASMTSLTAPFGSLPERATRSPRTPAKPLRSRSITTPPEITLMLPCPCPAAPLRAPSRACSAPTAETRPTSSSCRMARCWRSRCPIANSIRRGPTHGG